MKFKFFLLLFVVLISGHLQAAETQSAVQATSRDSTEGGPPGIFTVTDTTDEAGTCNPGDCSLREAIIASNARISATINFDGAVFSTPQTINLASALPNFGVSIDIIGPGADLLTIRRNSVDNFRIFTAPYAFTNTAISGLTLSNGDSAGDGGAILSNSSLTLDNVAIDSNRSAGSGGGVAIYAGGVFKNSTFSNNTGVLGGGIVFGNGATTNGRTLTMTNCTVSGNASQILGSGVLVNAIDANGTVQLDMVSNTVAFNSSPLTTAVFVNSSGASANAVLNVRNSIFTNSGSTGEVSRTFSNGGEANVNSLGYNLSPAILFDPPSVGDQNQAIPGLRPLADNGGQTLTHSLRGDSSALDSGNSSGSATDQRGLPRPFDFFAINPADGGDNADIGAVEMDDVILVTNDHDSGPGSLRQALLDSNTNLEIDYIQFDPEVFRPARTIRLLSPLPDIQWDLNLAGPGADLLTVQRQSGGDYRIFTIPGTFYVSISGLTLRNGKANTGGAIWSNTNLLKLTGMDISDNQAEFSGGGIAVTGSFIEIEGSTLSGNSAGTGGGISFDATGSPTSFLKILNTTISGNSATLGGGLFTNITGDSILSRIVIWASTLAGNSSNGSAFFADISVGTSAEIEIRMKSSIFANDGGPNFNTSVSGGNKVNVFSDGYNIYSDDASGMVANATDWFNTDPLLFPLSRNGGPTPTHALHPGSPALDAGFYNFIPLTDQRGFARPFDIGVIPQAIASDASDIGAVEMQAMIVTNANDSGAGSLREAMSEAFINGDGHDDILFDDGFFSQQRTINLAGALPPIETNLNILGPGADRLTVRRDTGGEYRLFNVLPGLASVSLSGLTLAEGASNGLGGAILSDSNLVLDRMVIVENGAITGGGLAVTGNTLIMNSAFLGNQASAQGTAINFQGSESSLTLINSTISDNSGPTAAVTVYPTAGEGLLDITNSTIAQNTGGHAGIILGGFGAGIVLTTSVNNSIISGNPGQNILAQSGVGGSSTVTSYGYNLIGDSGGGHFAATGDLITTDPLLGPVAQLGGPTPTHAVPSTSPAVDAGSCAVSLLAQDQRGFKRPFDLPGKVNAGDGCDIGATEWTDRNDNGVEDGEESFADGFEAFPAPF